MWLERRRAAAVMAVPSKAMRDRTPRGDDASRNNPPVDKLGLGLSERLIPRGDSALPSQSDSTRI